MKKNFQLIALIICSSNLFGQINYFQTSTTSSGNGNITHPGSFTINGGNLTVAGPSTYPATINLGASSAGHEALEATTTNLLNLNKNGAWSTVAIGGKVGIGTTSPAELLHVYSTSNYPRISVQSTSSTGAPGFDIRDPSGNPMFTWHYDIGNGFMGFYQYGIGNRMVINNSGNVGVGTASPSTLLHIFQGSSSLTKSTYSRAVIESNDHSQMDILSSANKESGIYLKSTGSSGSTYGGVAYYNEGTSTYGLSLYSGNSIKARILENGNLGIGSMSPSEKLEVNGNINVGLNSGATTGYGSRLNLLGADPSGDPLWLSRYNIAPNQTELRVNIGDDASGDDAFTIGNFYWMDGQWKTFLKVFNNGNVGIGTATTDARLTVRGQVHAQEVKVDLNGAVAPDYVFEKDYKLSSLEEIKNYIDQNKHLPEVPSAKEMEKNGVQLGEMNMLLLKKIEELTLYVIEQNRKIEQQKDINRMLFNEIEKLKQK